MLAVTVSGCSSLGGVGGSSFGNAALSPGEVADVASPDAASALKSGNAAFRNGLYGQSAGYFKHAVEMDPKNPRAYVGLGASYDRLGRFDLADKIYAALLSLTGETAQYYNNVGYSQMLRGNLSAALANFRKAKALDPDNPIISNNIKLLSNAAARA